MPPKNIDMKPHKKIINEVPKSGCFITKNIGNNIIKKHMTSFFRSISLSSEKDKNHAKHIGIIILRTSET